MSLPTVKFPARTSFLLQTASALGISYSAGWFSPFVKNAYYTPSAIAANGTITWSAGTTINDPVFTQMDTNYPVYRTVAGGLKLECIQSLTATTGYVYVMHYPFDNFSDLYGYTDIPTSEAAIAASIMVERYTLSELCQNPLVVPFRKVDHSSSRFRDVQFNNAISPTSEDVFGWCNIMIYIVGAAGGALSQVMTVERILHLEAFPAASASLQLGATPTAYEPRAMEEACHVAPEIPLCYVEQDNEGIIERVERFVYDSLPRLKTARDAFNNVSNMYKAVSSFGPKTHGWLQAAMIGGL